MPETIGQRLKREREARYLSLEKAAEETRIRRIFLQALEADDFSVMPSAAQGRGFLRNYAEYLDLDIDELIAEIQRNPIPPAEVSGPLPQVNLAETELPPLTDSGDEKPAARFLSRFLSRKPKADSTLEAVEEPAAESQSQPAAGGEADGADQPEVGEEARQGLWGRIRLRFKIKVDKEESLPAAVIPEEIVEPPAAAEKPADLIMAEIGAKLRERRELISLTVAEVERHTHLRANFVKALEDGAFDRLPSTVQTRGMLSNYATFLDLDVDEVLLRYADALQARRHEKYAEIPRDQVQTQVKPVMPMLRTFVMGDLAYGLLMIVVLAGLAVWGVGRIVSVREDVEPTASGEASVVTEVSAVATPQGLEGLASPEAIASPSDANVVVSVFALERVFVKILVDGTVAFEGRMPPRETKVFAAQDQVAILTGDGSALRITYNGTDLGLMGGPGEVVSRVYSISGVATPTATIPPTATITPLTTATSTATPTGTPTPPP